MTDISAHVRRLIEAGANPGIAAEVAADIFIAGVMSAPHRVDEAAERRRERDRERKRDVTIEVRLMVFKRDGEKCVYCGSTEGPFHLDHIYPVIRGGRGTPDNLAVACKPCNLSKGARTPEEWRGQ